MKSKKKSPKNNPRKKEEAQAKELDDELFGETERHPDDLNGQNGTTSEQNEQSRAETTIRDESDISSIREGSKEGSKEGNSSKEGSKESSASKSNLKVTNYSSLGDNLEESKFQFRCRGQ
jgi:hypothetical protein